MATPVIVAGSVSFLDDGHDWALHKCDAAGNLYPHGHRLPNHGAFLLSITGVAIDTAGNVYCCSRNNDWTGSTGYDDLPAVIPSAYGDNYEYPQWTVRKYNPDGVKIWQANRGAACHDLVIDGSGNAYVVGDAVNSSGVVLEDALNNEDRTGYFTTAAYSANGTLLWNADHGHCRSAVGEVPFFRIRVADGYVYTLANSSIFGTPRHLTKYDASDGAVVWSVDIDPSKWSIAVYDFAVDSSGNVYIAGRFSSAYAIAKYNNSGSFVAYAANPGSAKYGKAIAINGAGNIILGTAVAGGSNNALFKYDTSLTLLASQSGSLNAANITRIVLDADDVVYALRSTGSVAKYVGATSGFGDELWITEFTLKDDENSFLTGYALALSEVETPPLKLAVMPGLPVWIGDYYAAPPGLALSLAPGLPAWWRDYVGAPLPEIYRLYLTGSPTIELSLSSFSLRANAGGVFLSVVIPGASLETVEAIEARADETLILYRGIRFRDGAEQLDILVSATLQDVRYDAGARSGSLSLTGRVATTTDYPKTRALSGISYQAESAGARRVRSAVDTQLRVWDTALLTGDDPLTVASITITVSTTQASMEISE